MSRSTIVFTGKEQLELRDEEVPVVEPGKLIVKATYSLVSSGTEGIVFTPHIASRNFVTRCVIDAVTRACGLFPAPIFISRLQRKGDSRREAPGGAPASVEVIDR